MSKQGTLTIYTLTGTKIMETSDKNDMKSLPAGYYIVNGKEVMIK